MAMEVHDTLKYDMDRFIKECVCLFHNKQLRNYLSLYFCIQFFKHVNIVLQSALTFTIEKKIVSTSDVCSKPPIIIRSHNLHVGDITKALDEITSYRKRISFLPFLVPTCIYLVAFLWLSLFVSPVMVLAIDHFWKIYN
jgi:hypothetical protein